MDGGSWKLIGEPSRPDGLGPQEKKRTTIREIRMLFPGGHKRME
jgi:hypothetical protein